VQHCNQCMAITKCHALSHQHLAAYFRSNFYEVCATINRSDNSSVKKMRLVKNIHFSFWLALSSYLFVWRHSSSIFLICAGPILIMIGMLIFESSFFSATFYFLAELGLDSPYQMVDLSWSLFSEVILFTVSCWIAIRCFKLLGTAGKSASSNPRTASGSHQFNRQIIRQFVAAAILFSIFQFALLFGLQLLGSLIVNPVITGLDLGLSPYAFAEARYVLLLLPSSYLAGLILMPFVMVFPALIAGKITVLERPTISNCFGLLHGIVLAHVPIVLLIKILSFLGHEVFFLSAVHLNLIASISGSVFGTIKRAYPVDADTRYI